MSGSTSASDQQTPEASAVFVVTLIVHGERYLVMALAPAQRYLPASIDAGSGSSLYSTRFRGMGMLCDHMPCMLLLRLRYGDWPPQRYHGGRWASSLNSLRVIGPAMTASRSACRCPLARRSLTRL